MPTDATVAGRLALGGGGSDCVAIRLVGAARTEPVISGGADERDAKGLELGLSKRVVSELQPATPIANTPSIASRDHGRPANLTTARMGLLTRTQQRISQLKRHEVKIGLSRQHALNTNGIRPNSLQFARFSGQKRHKSHSDEVLARQALFSVR